MHASCIYTQKLTYVSAPWPLNATLKTGFIPFPSIPSTLCEMKWFSPSLIITVAIKPLALLLSFLSVSPHLYPSMLSSPSSLLHALVNLPPGLAFMHSKECRLHVFIVPVQTMGDVSAWVAIIGQDDRTWEAELDRIGLCGFPLTLMSPLLVRKCTLVMPFN